MKDAGGAMKKIHGGLTISKVDETMYVPKPIQPLAHGIRNSRQPEVSEWNICADRFTFSEL
jgi:hypothetical protein